MSGKNFQTEVPFITEGRKAKRIYYYQYKILLTSFWLGGNGNRHEVYEEKMRKKQRKV